MKGEFQLLRLICFDADTCLMLGAGVPFQLPPRSTFVFSLTNGVLRLSNANHSHSTCRVVSEQEPEIAHLGAQLNCQSRKVIQREENANM